MWFTVAQTSDLQPIFRKQTMELSLHILQRYFLWLAINDSKDQADTKKADFMKSFCTLLLLPNMYFYFSTALRTYLFSTEGSISILICLPVHMIVK